MGAIRHALERASRSPGWSVSGLLAAIVFGAAYQAAAAPPRVALVIGNSAYGNMPALPGCRLSAHAVAAALGRAGFTTTERYDQSNGEMVSAVADLTAQLAGGPAATAVVYVCGYGVGYNGRNFLLPVSARIERDTDALTQGILASSLQTALGRSAAGALVLLDMVAAPSGAALDPRATPERQPASGIAPRSRWKMRRRAEQRPSPRQPLAPSARPLFRAPSKPMPRLRTLAMHSRKRPA